MLTENGSKNLLIIEIIIFLVFIVIMLFSIGLRVYQNTLPFKKSIQILIWGDVAVLIIFNMVFIPFVYFFRKYQRAVYDKLKINIWVFYALEQLFPIWVILFPTDLVPKDKVTWAIDLDYIELGIQPIQQALCLYFLKSTLDPL